MPSSATMAAMLALLAGAEPARALRNVKVGETTPAFTVQTLDGKTLTSTEYKDKLLLLVFAKPKQKRSLTALRAAKKLLDENPASKLFALAVSTKPDTEEQCREIVKRLDLAYPFAQDPKRKMYGDFGLIVTPTTLLIDGSGVLRYELPHTPPNYEHKLRLHVDLMLGKISQQEHDTLLSAGDTPDAGLGDASSRRLAFARTLVQRRKFVQATPVLNELKGDEPSPEVAMLLGRCHLEGGRMDEAAKLLDPLADHEPASAALKITLARLEMHRGHLEKAEGHLLKALERTDEPASVLFYLGRVYQAQGETEKATSHYRRGLEGLFDPWP